MTTNIDDIAKNIEIREKEQKRSVILGVLRSTAGIRQAMSDAFKRRNADEVIRLASQLAMNPDVDIALELYMNCEKNKAADMLDGIDFDPNECWPLTDRGQALIDQVRIRIPRDKECRAHKPCHADDVSEEVNFDPDDEFQLTDEGRAFVKRMRAGMPYDKEPHIRESCHAAGRNNPCRDEPIHPVRESVRKNGKYLSEMKPCVKRSKVDWDYMDKIANGKERPIARKRGRPAKCVTGVCGAKI